MKGSTILSHNLLSGAVLTLTSRAASLLKCRLNSPQKNRNKCPALMHSVSVEKLLFFLQKKKIKITSVSEQTRSWFFPSSRDENFTAGNRTVDRSI